MANYMIIKIPVEIKKSHEGNEEGHFEFKKGFDWILPEMQVGSFLEKLKEIDALFIFEEKEFQVLH